MKNHSGSIVAMSADPHGKVLFTCGADSYIKYYEIDTGRIIKNIDAHRGPIVSMTINHRNGCHLPDSHQKLFT
jgi:WD40 repeat protein